MNPLAAVATATRILAAQRLTPEGLRRLQNAKLRRLVGHAYRSVPYYRRLFDDAGISPRDIRCPDDLTAVPITNRAILQRQAPDVILSRDFASAQLVEARTTGSSGRPFTFHFDEHFVRVRNALFLRALVAVGYRPPRRLLVITEGRRGRAFRWVGWHHAALTDPPEAVRARLEAVRPWAVHGATTALRQLAAAVQADPGPGVRPRVVVARGEVLDRTTRNLLAEAFDADVYDFYGMTEMGMLAWECRERSGYHLSEDTAIVELIPGDAGPEEQRLVVTNLELRTMPLIRFDTGDLARPGPGGTCRCGRTFRRLAGIEGRTVDCLRLRDGRTISPYQVTLALESLPGIARFQLVQTDWDRFTVRLEQRGDREGDVEPAIRQALARVLGPTQPIAFERARSLDPPPGVKFRVVQCSLPAEARREGW